MVAPIDQMRAVLHYRKHRDTYNTIQGRLLAARRSFLAADREEQALRLVKAHTWSVISIQTPVHIHESAFEQLWADADTIDEMLQNLDNGALDSVNYKNNKADYIREFATSPDDQRAVAEFLAEGRLDAAQKYIIDNVKGVGTVKAPFMLGNNGFTEKMCLDANVINLMGIDKPNTVVVERYNKLCRQVAESFPALNKMLDEYLLQWVIFDYKRNKDGRADGPSKHTVWFDEIDVV